ncbi:glycohydrolase toxin TNT-related protein [Saccharothrix algeriensis]|uniref:Glycohydrolase toxin TNT-related protein n=1 Tax=Saccharothrix algeriensis TaxID=173560 RepID=A0A8T8HT31_9PSEU|nr:glycohydrolase toxin TNT-related protein [Saccharothrix algeriensis]
MRGGANQGFPAGTAPGHGFAPGAPAGHGFAPGAPAGQGFPPVGGAGFGSLSGVLGTGSGSSAAPTQLAGPPQRAARDARPADEATALFLLHVFPGGVLPPAQAAPARQLPPPPEEQDFAPGLRFEPQGHPDGHLVDDSARERPGSRPGPATEPDPALTDGYDPQAGMHERDWDRRFLVRPDPPEYAWPPAELFPEGGYEAGQPGVLAVGVELDRFGSPEGRVLSEAGTPFAHRSLPPAALAAGYHRYRVVRELPVWFTLSAEWFGQAGGGVRYRATHPVAELVALGYLEESR